MKMKLFVLGDSISIHYGLYLKAYVESCMEFRRKGGQGGDPGDLDRSSTMNGGDSAAVLSYLKSGSEPVFDSDILLLNCGLHDIKTDPATGARQVSEDAYRENLKSIFEFVGHRSLKAVWVRTTHVDELVHNTRCKSFHRFDRDVQLYNKIADEEVKAAGLSFIDLNGFTRKLEPGVFCDHVHFTEPVRALQAAFIAGSLFGILGKGL